MITMMAFVLAALSAASPAVDMSKINTDLEELNKVIGTYPPNVTSEEQLKAVRAKYDGMLATLNDALKNEPENNEYLLARGKLYRMGHNLDIEGAFKASEADFLALLNKNALKEQASLALGDLYVNSDPEKAPRAEQLFQDAQKAHGEQLLEAAQAGLFFAYYYQGKMKEALAQAELLVKHWPDNAQYKEIRSMTEQVIQRSQKDGKKPKS